MNNKQVNYLNNILEFWHFIINFWQNDQLNNSRYYMGGSPRDVSEEPVM